MEIETITRNFTSKDLTDDLNIIIKSEAKTPKSILSILIQIIFCLC